MVFHQETMMAAAWTFMGQHNLLPIIILAEAVYKLYFIDLTDSPAE
jgi:hypothetical protein